MIKPSTTPPEAATLVAGITCAIHTIRGQRVLLDVDLAALYGVATKRLNEQVRRNRTRFPDDFVFRLSPLEDSHLRSQIATSKVSTPSRGGRRSLPYAFTEHGAIMAATVLNSPRAVATSLFIVRAFIRIREAVINNQELERQLSKLEQKLLHHDETITAILSAIRVLMAPPADKRRGIGFTADFDDP